MSDKRPNILLIFPDQYRGDWTEMNPDVPVKTPNLKNMVEEGVYFKQALTPSPLCAPARACLASGTNYDNCNIINNGQPYPSEQTTFYKLLQDSGYHTMACGKFDLHKPLHKFMKDGRKIFNGIDYFEVWGFSDGMDNGGKHDGVKAYRSGKENMGPYLYYLEQKGLAKTHIRDFALRGLFPAKATPLSDEDYADNYIGRNALKLLDRAPKNKPWFLQVNFNGPHEPFDITKSMKNRWKNVEFPDPYDSSLFSHRKNQGIRQNYAAMLENLDRWIGILSDELKKRGEYENTIIVFSSDHGEMLADHNHMSKTTPYHPSSNVPLFIKGPNIVKGKIIEKGVSIVDLAGTFLDYAGFQRLRSYITANSPRPTAKALSPPAKPKALRTTTTFRTPITKWSNNNKLWDGRPWPSHNQLEVDVLKYFALATTFLALMTLTGCPSENGSPKSSVKVPESQVNRSFMETAASFATKLCNKWNRGEFDPISSSSATTQLISALPPEAQKKLFEEQIKPEYGEFRRLFYKETYTAGGNHIFRFRGDFEKGGPEVRVTITPMGLVGGFGIRPWSEELS